MKKNLSQLLIFGICLFFILGCGALNKIKQGIDDAQKPKIITSSDGKCQLTVPGGWRDQKGLHEDASLQAANPVAELYVVVIPDDKADFNESADLDFITKIIRDNLSQTVGAPVLVEPVAATTINGLPAKQFEASGEVDKMKIKYIYAVVDAPQNYYQVITWTLNSRFEKNKDKMAEVIKSFKETGRGEGSPVVNTPTKIK